MEKPVDFYDSLYGHVENEIYREVRVETFGEDLGQTSWITAPECDEFCRWLGLTEGRHMLDVACGTGGTDAYVAERWGVSVQGVDISKPAIRAATARAKALGLADRVEFRIADADDPLPFPDESFDALFCNDSINHFRDRARVLADWHRVLRPGGRCLYTDPIVVTGCLTSGEIEARSSIGFFLFTPKGRNEKFIRAAGFRLVLTADLTAAVAHTSIAWRDARNRREQALRSLEGDRKFESVQGFLTIVHTLAAEGRLSRFAFIAEKKA